jgi:hypothetical protein
MLGLNVEICNELLFPSEMIPPILNTERHQTRPCLPALVRQWAVIACLAASLAAAAYMRQGRSAVWSAVTLARTHPASATAAAVGSISRTTKSMLLKDALRQPAIEGGCALDACYYAAPSVAHCHRNVARRGTWFERLDLCLTKWSSDPGEFELILLAGMSFGQDHIYQAIGANQALRRRRNSHL